MKPQYDPQVERDDIRSLKRYFRQKEGVSSEVVMIHYIGPNEFRVFVTRHFFVVERDEELGWKIKDEGTWMA